MGVVEERIGKFNLQRGDDDKHHVYGGLVRHFNADGQSIGPAAYVAELKDLLARFRIFLFEGPSGRSTNPRPAIARHGGDFDLYTEWAVKEFQIYAKAPRWAKKADGSDDLVSAPKDDGQIYKGPVSGVIDDETRRFMQIWFDNEWIVPIRIYTKEKPASKKKPKRPALDDLWGRFDLHWFGVPVYVQDHSGFYEPYYATGPKQTWNLNLITRGLVAPSPAVPSFFAVTGQDYRSERTLGGFKAMVPKGKSYATQEREGTFKLSDSAGPVVDADARWPDAEMLPERLTGHNPPTMTEAEGAASLRSTYKAVRALSEQEGNANFHDVNGYDSAVISLGPTQSTVVLRGGAGELGGMFALARHRYPESFALAFERYGLSCEFDWGDGVADSLDRATGESLTRTSKLAGTEQMKYGAAVALQRRDGAFRSPVSEYALEAEWLRSWHWIYRFAMAGYAVVDWRRTMWDVARLRMRDLLRIPIEDAGNRNLTSLVTSEASVAALLRIHVKLPGYLVGKKSTVPTAVVAALQQLDDDTEKDEEAFLQALTQRPSLKLSDETKTNIERGPAAWWRIGNGGDIGSGEVAGQIRRVMSWPAWLALKEKRQGEEPNTIRKRLVGNPYALKLSHLYDTASTGYDNVDNNAVLLMSTAKNLSGNTKSSFSLFSEGLGDPWWRVVGLIDESELANELKKCGFDPATVQISGIALPVTAARRMMARELQVAAGYPLVRQPSSTSANTRRYTGPIGQVSILNKPTDQRLHYGPAPRPAKLTPSTSQLLTQWTAGALSPQLKISVARKRAGQPDDTTNLPSNYWGDGTPYVWSAPSDSYVLYADDATGVAGLPARWLVGRLVPHGAGARLEARNELIGTIPLQACDLTAEVTPLNLLGRQVLEGIPGVDDTRSRFKILRALAERLFGGFLDGVTVDNGASLRFSFWTLSLRSTDEKKALRVVGKPGEVGGFLAYLQHTSPLDCADLVAANGLVLKNDWLGKISVERAKHVAAVDIVAGDPSAELSDSLKGKYLNLVHWAYRFQAITRGDKRARVRRAVWDFALLQYATLLRTRWPLKKTTAPQEDGESVGQRDAVLGDYFRSEQGRAVLFSLQVVADPFLLGVAKPPPKAKGVGKPFALLNKALRANTLPADPYAWTDENETILVDAVIAETLKAVLMGQGQAAHDELKALVEGVRTWTYNGPRPGAGDALQPKHVEPLATVLQLKAERRAWNLPEQFEVPAPGPAGAAKVASLVQIRPPTVGAGGVSPGLALAFGPEGVQGLAFFRTAETGRPLRASRSSRTPRAVVRAEIAQALVIPFKTAMDVEGLEADDTPLAEAEAYESFGSDPEPLELFPLKSPQAGLASAALDFSIVLGGADLVKAEATATFELTQDGNGNTSIGVKLDLEVSSDIVGGKLSFGFDTGDLTFVTGPGTGEDNDGYLGVALKFDPNKVTPSWLPIRLTEGSGRLILGVGGGVPFLRAEIDAKGLSAELGTPLVELAIAPADNKDAAGLIRLSLDTRTGIEARVGQPRNSATQAAARVLLNLFPFSRQTVAPELEGIIGHVVEAIDKNGVGLPFVGTKGISLEIATISGPGPAPLATTDRIYTTIAGWSRGNAAIAKWVFSQIKPKLPDCGFRMGAFAGSLPARDGRLDVQMRFGSQEVKKDLELVLDEPNGSLALTVPVVLDVAKRHPNEPTSRLFMATGSIGIEVIWDAESDDALTSFSEANIGFSVGAVVFEVAERHDMAFAGIASLQIPSRSRFELSLDARNPSIAFTGAPGSPDGKSILFAVPARDVTKPMHEPSPKSFTFEIDTFKIAPEGLDLVAGVRAESVPLWDPQGGLSNPSDQNATGLGKPLAVEPPAAGGGSRVGELELRGSRIVRASLAATAQLHFFDDAVGKLTVEIAERSEGGYAVAGTLAVSPKKPFRLEAMFAEVQVSQLTFGLTYETQKKKWGAIGLLTGNLRFRPPQGRSESEAGVFAELFKDMVVSFEDLDVVGLGVRNVTIEVTPRRFTFADILRVTIRGIAFGVTNGSIRNFRILGDIELLKLPGLDAELKFSGITIREIGSLFEGRVRLPQIDVEAIGIKLRMPGGFAIEGEIRELKNEKEYGFGGAATVDIEGLPGISVLVKLTRVTVFQVNSAGVAEAVGQVPSVVVHIDAEVTIHIYAGIYLRRVGLGVGFYNSLRGLADNKKSLPQVIEKLVEDSRGLPMPGLLSSWEPAPPDKMSGPLRWTLVAAAYLTWGKADSDVEHPITASVFLALDEQFRIVAGANHWLFTSPDQARTLEFLERPWARGAIGISPRERTIYASYKTLPNPKLSDRVPEILGKIASVQQTTLRLLVNPNGAIYEYGWPWENGIRVTIGPFYGELISGFRAGIYRDAFAVGMNLGVAARLNSQTTLGFSTRWGGAGASISVYGEAYFRASLAGAITNRAAIYLLGDVRFGITLRASVSCFIEFRIKIGFIKISIAIRFSVSIELTVTCALAGAITSDGIGFTGDVTIAIGVCGYHLSGTIPFRYQAERVDATRDTISRLMPPISEIIGRMPARARALRTVSSIEAPKPVEWACRLKLVGDRLWVLFVPEVEADYPAVVEDELDKLDRVRGSRVKFAKAFSDLVDWDNSRFAGYAAPIGPDRLSSVSQDGTELSWREDLIADVPLLDAEIDKDVPAQQPPRLADCLRTLPAGGAARLAKTARSVDEIVDPRSIHPEFGPGDEPGADFDPRRPSSRIPRRSAEAGQKSSYDERIAAGTTSGPAPSATPLMGAEASASQAGAGLSTPLIATDLIERFNAASAPETMTPELGVFVRRLLVLRIKDPSKISTENPETLFRQVFGSGDRLPVDMVGQPATLGLPRSWPTGTYDLVMGSDFQAAGEIALTWDLRCFKAGHAVTDPSRYDAVDVIEVKRINLSTSSDTRLAEHTAVRRIRPTWHLSRDDGTDGWIYVRPQFQFVDNQLAGVSIGDVLQYEVTAYSEEGLDGPGKAKVLASAGRLVTYSPARVIPRVSQTTALQTTQTPIPRVAPPKLRQRIEIVFTVPKRQVDIDGYDVQGSGSNQELVFDGASFFAVLACRIVPAETSGFYGAASESRKTGAAAAAVQARSRDGAGNLGVETIKLVELDQNSPIPWNQVIELSTLTDVPKPTFAVVGDGTKEAVIAGYFVFDSSEAHFKKLYAHLGAGEALQLFVGLRERDWSEADPAKRRTPLAQARHAVIGSRTYEEQTVTRWPPQPDALDRFLAAGVDVGKLELGPPSDSSGQPRDTEFVGSGEIVARARYGEFVEAVETAGTESKTLMHSSVRIRWRHQPMHAKWGAAVGYRVWMADALDVIPRGETGLAFDPPIDVEVFSEAEYRGRRQLIVPIIDNPAGTGTGEPDWGLSAASAQFPNGGFDFKNVILVPPTESFENVFQDRDGPSGPIRLHGALVRFAEDVAKQLGKRLGMTVQARYAAFLPLLERGAGLLPLDKLRQRMDELRKELEPEMDPYGWRGLELLGLSCTVEFVRADGGRVALQEHEGLVGAGKVSALAEATAHADPNLLVTEFLGEDGKTQHFALRLFYAPSLAGPRIGPKDVVPQLWKNVLHAMELHLIGRGVKGGAFVPVKGNVLECIMDRASPAEPTCPTVPPEIWPGPLPWMPELKGMIDGILDDITERMAKLSQPPKSTQAHPAETVGKVATMVRRPPPRQPLSRVARELPVLDGWLELDVAMPGQLGAVRLIAVECLYRHDLVFGEHKVQSAPLVAGEPPKPVEWPWFHDGDLVRPFWRMAKRTRTPIPLRGPEGVAKAVKVTIERTRGAQKPVPFAAVIVDRVRELKEHALVARSLRGGVEALVYVHPAAHAARSNTVYASRGQYTGMHVSLDRRIGRRADWKEALETLTEVNWPAYARHVAALVAKDVAEVGAITFTPTAGQEARHPYTPLERTTHTRFGVERVIVPDAPPDYEYRFQAFSTAGRVKSDVAQSSFVKPEFEPWKTVGGRNVPGRLSPAIPVGVSAYAAPRTEGKGPPVALRIQVPLLPLRSHRDPRARLLWDESDVKLGEANDMAFSRLPDLAAGYLLFGVTNPREVASGGPPVVIPLARIIAPLGSSNVGRYDSAWRRPHRVEVLLEGLRVIDPRAYGGGGRVLAVTSEASPPDELSADDQRGKQFAVVPMQPRAFEADGRPIMVELALDVSDPRCATFGQLVVGLLAKPASQTDATSLVLWDLERDGFHSPIGGLPR